MSEEIAGRERGSLELSKKGVPTMRREEYIAGLHEFAEWIEAHPEVPIPEYLDTAIGWGHLHSPEEAATAARALGHVNKEWQDRYLVLTHDFGPIQLRVVFNRESVCTRQVVGSEWVPAQTVEGYTREIVEWNCEPLVSVRRSPRPAVQTRPRPPRPPAPE